MEMVKYSIVIPLYNEESGIAVLVEKLQEIIAQFDGPAEAVLDDDGSKDRMYELGREVAGKDQRFQLLQFSRHFGHQVAITAGVDAAPGDAVIIMDADLQDPPDVVLQM